MNTRAIIHAIINLIFALRFPASRWGLTWQPHRIDTLGSLIFMGVFGIGEVVGGSVADEPYCPLKGSGDSRSGVDGCDGRGRTSALQSTHEHSPGWRWKVRNDSVVKLIVVEVMRRSRSTGNGIGKWTDYCPCQVGKTGSDYIWVGSHLGRHFSWA